MGRTLQGEYNIQGEQAQETLPEGLDSALAGSVERVARSLQLACEVRRVAGILDDSLVASRDSANYHHADHSSAATSGSDHSTAEPPGRRCKRVPERPRS